MDLRDLPPTGPAVLHVLRDVPGKHTVAELVAQSGVSQKVVRQVLTWLGPNRGVYHMPQLRKDAPPVDLWWLSPSGKKRVAAVLRKEA